MNRNGLILYAGPSRIDGAPIVVVATGLRSTSGNEKTGAMVQTWILRADVSPIEALRTGLDVSICGGCIHRPEGFDGSTWWRRSCYVNIATAPTGVYSAFRRGSYPDASGDPDAIAEAMRGRMVRLGSYGDPAAVPAEVWEACTRHASGWTGYTHQARRVQLRDVLRWCQVSADSCEDAEAARRAGVGSFRVLAEGEAPAPFEMVCPASEEMGKVTTCAECQACTGWDGANVAIRAHGIGATFHRPTTRRPLSLPVLNSARAPLG